MLPRISMLLCLGMMVGRHLALRKSHFLYHSVMLAAKPPPPGPATSIVILHGLLGNAKNFQSLVKLLHKEMGHMDIVVIDLLSHGRSKVLGDFQLDYRSMAEDVLHTCRKLKMPKVHLIGHSMGGKVTAAACLDEQSDVDILSATLLDISPVKYSENKEFKEVMHTIDFLETVTEGITDSTSKADLTKAIEETFDDKDFRLFLGSNLVEGKNELQWRFSVKGIARSRQSLLDWDERDVTPFDRPMFLLKGGESSFVKTSHLEAVKQQFPLYNLQSMKGIGHWLHAEAPVKTAAAIVNFLQAATKWHEKK